MAQNTHTFHIEIPRCEFYIYYCKHIKFTKSKTNEDKTFFFPKKQLDIYKTLTKYLYISII